MFRLNLVLYLFLLIIISQLFIFYIFLSFPLQIRRKMIKILFLINLKLLPQNILLRQLKILDYTLFYKIFQNVRNA